VVFLWGGGTRLICVLKQSVCVLCVKTIPCPNRRHTGVEGRQDYIIVILLLHD